MAGQLAQRLPVLAVFAFIPLVIFFQQHGFLLPALFNIHVLCMLVGAGALLPVVAGSLVSGVVEGDEKRDAHARIAYATLIIVGVGMLAIFLHKASLGKPLLSFSLHASSGWLLLAAFAAQGVSGRSKLQAMRNSGARVHRWHGLSGAAVCVAAYGVIALGLARMMAGPALALALLGCALPAACLAAVFIQRIYSRTQMNSYASVPVAEDAPHAVA